MRILKTAAILFLATSFATTALARPVKVEGSRIKTGKHRKGHVRSSPNKSRLDNYDTMGRVNPRTGKPGMKEPFSR